MNKLFAIAVLAAASFNLAIPMASAQGSSGVTVWGGPCISPEANARFESLVVTNDRGENATISLADEKGEVQYFFSSSLPFTKKVSSLSYRAAGAYPGAKYEDVLISEIRLDYADTSEDEMVKGGQ
jgi:hypothetical protein